MAGRGAPLRSQAFLCAIVLATVLIIGGEAAPTSGPSWGPREALRRWAAGPKVKPLRETRHSRLVPRAEELEVGWAHPTAEKEAFVSAAGTAASGGLTKPAGVTAGVRLAAAAALAATKASFRTFAAVEESKVAAVAAPVANPYVCKGRCCSSSAKSPADATTGTMLSRWFTNAMYDGAKVHFWGYSGQVWQPASNQFAPPWTGQLSAVKNSPLSDLTTITIQRLSKNQVRLRAPGGGYITAMADWTVAVTPKASANSVFTFTQLGSEQVYLKTALGTYVTMKDPTSLVHWDPSKYNSALGMYEAFYVYEVMSVPSFRGVNLGSWLYSEPWMVPALYTGMQTLANGVSVHLYSSVGNGYVSAPSGGKQKIVCNAPQPNAYETFTAHRFTGRNNFVQLVTWGSYYVSSNLVPSKQTRPTSTETFRAVQRSTDPSSVMLQAMDGRWLTAHPDGSLSLVAGPSPQKKAWTAATTFKVSAARSTCEYHLCQAIGPKACARRVKQHWATFITEADFAFMCRQGVNAVRIPVGWWIAQGRRAEAPFVAGGYRVLDWAFQMGEKYGITILVSMHATPGGACSPSAHWTWQYNTTNSIGRTLDSIEWLAQRYANSPAFAGIGVLNEPDITVPHKVLIDFYFQAYDRIRKHSQCAYVAFTDVPGGGNGQFYDEPGWSNQNNILTDSHSYPIFQASLQGARVAAVIDSFLPKVAIPSMLASQEAGPWISLVGEWSAALPVSTGPADVKRFWAAQEAGYSAAHGGWFFWSYKLGFANDGTWDFRRAAQLGYVAHNPRGGLL